MEPDGAALRNAREAAGVSLREMARRTHFSKSMLGYIEHGERVLTPEVVLAYERELGEVINRRGVLSGLAATVLAPMATSELIYKGFSDAAYRRPDLDTWLEGVEGLGHDYMTEGAASLQPRIAADLVTLQGQLGSPQLWGVASRYLTTYGKTTPGAKQAAKWYGLAATAADRSNDQDTRVWVRGRSALALAYEGAGLTTARRLADQALEISDKPTLGRLNALVARAHVAGFKGDAATVRTMVNEARHVFDVAGSEEQISDFAVPEWRFHVFLSMLYSRLGDERRAIEEQDAAARVIPENLPRFRTHIEMHRGLALVRSGDAAGGTDYARRALDLLPPEKHSLTLKLLMAEIDGVGAAGRD
ncbi:helix-turn-helix domain-containing protein [Catenulispora yoronensis]|uniref:helix-turn-helix domain-containing protein n=1 Tax=Catenulispora yoronensis TaxID=450799 RepID=UPI003CD09509